MRRRIFSLGLAVFSSLALVTGSASAITYGQPDGNAHPNAGAFLAEFRTPGVKEALCSGTLIAPTIFLTAAHCVTHSLDARGIPHDAVWVTFDANYVQASSPAIHGVAYADPAYNQSQSDVQDLAVIILDHPASDDYPGITPAGLPTLGQLDAMSAQNGLKDTVFTTVGYGAVESGPVDAGHSFYPQTTRRSGTGSFNSLSNGFLRLSGNDQHGDTGTCFGDSGGPNFIGTSGVIAAITVGGDSQCKATNVDYRLDLASARSFLGQYVNLP
jgi:V8-like Glu-specific endopeptidase